MAQHAPILLSGQNNRQETLTRPGEIRNQVRATEIKRRRAVQTTLRKQIQRQTRQSSKRLQTQLRRQQIRKKVRDRIRIERRTPAPVKRQTIRTEVQESRRHTTADPSSPVSTRRIGVVGAESGTDSTGNRTVPKQTVIPIRDPRMEIERTQDRRRRDTRLLEPRSIEPVLDRTTVLSPPRQTDREPTPIPTTRPGSTTDLQDTGDQDRP